MSHGRNMDTVKQLAARLRPLRDDPDRARLVRRIRHWTLVGLLPTDGDLHVGEGRHRRYQPDTAFTVALLEELARHDLGVGSLKAVMFALAAYRALRTRDDRDPIGEAMRGERSVAAWFSVSEAPDGWGIGVQMMVDPPGLDLPDSVTSALVVNLTKVFSRVQG